MLPLTFSSTGADRYNQLLGVFARDAGVTLHADKPARTFDSFAASCLIAYGTKNRWEPFSSSGAMEKDALVLEVIRKVVQSLNERFEAAGRVDDSLAEDDMSLLGYLDLITKLKTSLIFHERFAYLKEEEPSDEDLEDLEMFQAERGLPLYAFSLLNAFENMRNGQNFLLHGDGAYPVRRKTSAFRARRTSRLVPRPRCAREFCEAKKGQSCASRGPVRIFV